MLKSKALDILKSFSDEELKKFRDFVRSPYHNKNSNVIKLYELIRKYHPEYTNSSLDKEKLFRKLYPGKKYNDNVMRILLSDLGRLAEEFLSDINIVSNPYVTRRHLLKELQLRRIDNVFNKVLKETEAVLSVKELGKEYSFYYTHDLESIKNNFYLARNKQDLTSSIIQKKGASIIFYTLIDLLILSESILSNRNAYNIVPQTDIVNEFLGRLDIEGLIEYTKYGLPEYYPVIGVFFYLHKTINDPADEKYFNLAQKLFRENMDDFNLNEKILLYSKIQNVCKEKSRAGNDNFIKELFMIYKERMEKNLLILPRRKYLNIWDYRDILITALELGEISWAEEFVAGYNEFLAPEQQESGLNYGSAVINFGKGNFEAALENLSRVKYDFFIFKIDVKNLTAKIYFELGYFTQAFELIDNYRHFLNKNGTVSVAFRNHNSDFIKLYSELLKVKDRNGEGLTNLIFNLEKHPATRDRNWLAAKVKEMETLYA